VSFATAFAPPAPCLGPQRLRSGRILWAACSLFIGADELGVVRASIEILYALWDREDYKFKLFAKILEFDLLWIQSAIL